MVYVCFVGCFPYGAMILPGGAPPKTWGIGGEGGTSVGGDLNFMGGFGQ